MAGRAVVHGTLVPVGNAGMTAGLRCSGRSASRRRCRPGKDDREHITLAEQYSAAGRTLTAHLSSRHPSIYRTYIDATQASDLSFREKLFVTGVFREHIHLS